MCGICGFYSQKRISGEQLSAMNNTLVHRGPDDSGVQILDGGNGYHVGLAHRRLSILDLSMAGHQPMWSVENRVAVVYNGELYNYDKLKDELKGYPFKTTCDTEVLIGARIS